MSLGEAFDVAHIAEAILRGKQPLGPILAELQSAIADFELALKHLSRAISSLQAVNTEIEAAKKG